MRLYVSGKTRRWMIAVAVALACGWFVLTMLDADGHPGSPTSVGWTLLCTGVVLYVITVRATRIPDAECSFCGLPRAKVPLLIAGTAVSTCDACAALSLAVMTEDLAAKTQPGSWQRLIVNSLPRQCPVKISRPLLEAMVDERSDVETLRTVAMSCLKLANEELALELFARIPESDRRVDDWLNLGFAQGSVGRYDEAVVATAAALQKTDDAWRPWCLNNGAAYGHRRQPDAPVEVREAWLRDVAEAKRLVSERRAAGWQTVMQSIHGTEAELRHALGDPSGALQALTGAEKLGPLGGERHLIRAKILASGDPPLGRHDAEQALALLHPDSLHAREARALLAKLTETHGGGAA